jgi:hypothetical protein
MITEEIAAPTLRRPGQHRLHTVQQFCQEHAAFTIGGLRWLLFHRETNGLASAVVKLGRRVLIDEDKFFEWINEQNSRGKGEGQ